MTYFLRKQKYYYHLFSSSLYNNCIINSKLQTKSLFLQYPYSKLLLNYKPNFRKFFNGRMSIFKLSFRVSFEFPKEEFFETDFKFFLNIRQNVIKERNKVLYTNIRKENISLK